MRVNYLTAAEVMEIHADQIERYSGSHGLRDRGLLDSALAVPEATFDGVDLHATLCEKAAAYLYHIAKNHPFVDGNKRAACVVALVFLALNGESIEMNEDALYKLGMGVAQGDVSKSEIAVFFQARVY